MISMSEQIKHNIKKYHIYVPCDKWKEFVINSDLRFFKHKKHLLDDLLMAKYDGIMLSMCSWNYSWLKDAYALSNKIKHINFIKHLCYFEYEEDIVQYLCPYDTEEDNEENAVILSPAYKELMQFDLNKQELCQIIKQIFFSIYIAFCEYDICFLDIDINNIYIESQNKSSKIKYKINKKDYVIQSNLIVKIDEYVNIRQINKDIIALFDIYSFYGSLVMVFQQMSDKYELQSIINFIKDFQVLNERIIHPIKTIDIILRKIECELSR